MSEDSHHIECEGKTDEELVGLVLGAGSTEGAGWYACIVERYEERLLRFVRRISGVSQEDAEDVLQEVFVKAYYRLASFDSRGGTRSFSAWLYRIARNETVSGWRRLSRRAEGNMVDMDDEDVVRVAEAVGLDVGRSGGAGVGLGEGAGVGLTDEERRGVVRKVFGGMRAKYREVLELRYVEDLSYDEISQVIRKPAGTVGTLLNRAKKEALGEAKKLGIEIEDYLS